MRKRTARPSPIGADGIVARHCSRASAACEPEPGPAPPAWPRARTCPADPLREAPALLSTLPAATSSSSDAFLVERVVRFPRSSQRLVVEQRPIATAVSVRTGVRRGQIIGHFGDQLADA